MSAPANKAKALSTGETGPMSSAIAGIRGRAAVKLRYLEITALILDVAAS